MKIDGITQETLRAAFRTLRLQAGLTQAELSRRTEELQPPLKRINPNQVCAFERGGAIPSLMSFLSFLTACSADGATLDFSRFQEALTGEPFARVGPPTCGLPALWSELKALRSEVTALCSTVQKVELVGRDAGRKDDGSLLDRVCEKPES